MATLLYGSGESANETKPMQINAPASRVPAGENQVAAISSEDIAISTSSRRTQPMGSVGSPRWDDEPGWIPPPMPIMKRPFPALPAMLAGLLSTAAVWAGLALVLIAAAYPLSDSARVVLTLIGTSLLAVVVVFAVNAKPEYA